MTYAYKTIDKVLCVPPTSIGTITGTWTLTQSSGDVYLAKTAADNTATIIVPFTLPRDEDGSQGNIRINQVVLNLRRTTADLDAAVTAALYRCSASGVVVGAGTDATATSMAVTLTGDAVTAAATDRLLKAVVNTPAWDNPGDPTVHYQFVVTVNAAASTVVQVRSAFWYYNEKRWGVDPSQN